MSEPYKRIKHFRRCKLPSEDEILTRWGVATASPRVSILCNTFNHEAYIEDAIRGFLIQRADFPFEVIVHDDASTDRTAEKVAEYANCYPHIIKPVFQEANQFSRGIRPITLSFRSAKGKYIALCDGDDFWVDEDKLQRQVAELAACPDVAMSAHAAYTMDPSGAIGVRNEYRCNFLDVDFLIRGGGGVVPTSSVVFRREVMDGLPQWFHDVPVGDYFIKVLAGAQGVRYSGRVSSVYRVGASSSVSSARAGLAGHQLKDHLERYLLAISKLEERFGDAHAESFEVIRSKVKKIYARRFLINDGDADSFKRLIGESAAHQYGIEHKILVRFQRWPGIVQAIYKVRDKVRFLRSALYGGLRLMMRK